MLQGKSEQPAQIGDIPTHVEETSMQPTFGDAEGSSKRKQTRREIFLAEIE